MSATPSVQLTWLRIEKFRAITGATIELREATALVGQNGSGKSSVLRAINAFFNFEDEREDFETGRHAYRRNHQSVIEVTIEGLDVTPALPMIKTGDNVLRAQLKFLKRPIWKVYSEGTWQNAPDGFHEELRKQVSFALVPTRRDHLVAHGTDHGLLQRAAAEWITNNKQRDRVSPKIQQAADSLHKNTLSGLQKQLRKVSPLDGPFEFELRFATEPDYRLLLPSLTLAVREGGQSIQLADSGSGTQSMAIFALYAYLAELESKAIILGVEEPEQNLHPQAQRQLTRTLVGMGLQVIFTTHSPTVVDTLEHEQVILCRRVTGTSRGLESHLTQIDSEFFTRNHIDRESYYRFHRRRNSEFLFADYVVVTESPIDSAVVETLLKDAGKNPGALGISFVALDGVTSIEHMFFLLRELGIAAAFVVDKDYFLPYKGVDRKSSLDSRGYPQYKSTPRSGTLLQVLFSDAADQKELVRNLLYNHSAAMATLRSVGIFCFRYSLEVDLVVAEASRSRLFAHLKLSDVDKTEAHLLKVRYSSKGIKSQEAVLKAISGLAPSALPNSYKALRRELPALAASARDHP